MTLLIQFRIKTVLHRHQAGGIPQAGEHDRVVVSLGAEQDNPVLWWRPVVKCDEGGTFRSVTDHSQTFLPARLHFTDLGVHQRDITPVTHQTPGQRDPDAPRSQNMDRPVQSIAI